MQLFAMISPVLERKARICGAQYLLTEGMNAVSITEVKYCSQGIIKTSTNLDHLENSKIKEKNIQNNKVRSIYFKECLYIRYPFKI
jgi:hypothetical protein